MMESTLLIRNHVNRGAKSHTAILSASYLDRAGLANLFAIRAITGQAMAKSMSTTMFVIVFDPAAAGETQVTRQP